MQNKIKQLLEILLEVQTEIISFEKTIFELENNIKKFRDFKHIYKKRVEITKSRMELFIFHRNNLTTKLNKLCLK